MESTLPDPATLAEPATSGETDCSWGQGFWVPAPAWPNSAGLCDLVRYYSCSHVSHTANLILCHSNSYIIPQKGLCCSETGEVRGHSARRVQGSQPGLPDSLLYPTSSLGLLMAASRFSGDRTEARACQTWSPEQQHLCFQGKGSQDFPPPWERSLHLSGSSTSVFPELRCHY